jgi:hypothetical protein
MPHEVDPFRVDVRGALDLLDEVGQIPGVVDPGMVKVAAGIGRVPVVIAVAVDGPIGPREDSSSLRSNLSEPQVRVRFGAGRPVAVQQEEEWGRTLGSG